MFATLALSVAAITLLLVSGTQFAMTGFSVARASKRARTSRSREMYQLRQAAQVARLKSELHSVANGSEMQWRVMEVAQVIQESDDCRSFYLVDPYGQALPDFRPGQYLMVRPAIAGAFQTTRCYSLSAAPDPRYWRITVKRQELPAGVTESKRGGGLSIWLHDTIRSGDCLLIGGPGGAFYLPAENRKPLVLLAAGVGITPMASMLRWSLEKTPGRPVTLFYQAKDTTRWPLGENVHRWQASFPHCQVRTFFSRLDSADLQLLKDEYSGDFSSGRIDLDSVANVDHASDSDFYMCGPDAWMESMREGLVAAGIQPDRIHWESFGGVGSQPSSKPAGEHSAVAVRFAHSDVEVEWTDPEQSLWELARASQVEIPSGCLSGVCGGCRVKLLSGQVEYDRKISIELSEDECLTCVGRPTCAVTLDV
ncbi:2Fe-2S iron-sulfur cluster-binding protein [Aureliella helgolandensis]|uniref:Flavohemoprotein n=1 Tax=Aureliella helgolandensis TaxID=2527968 RepID=A0A518GEG6_9BACT|nr:2Fe-2S iron-sulfur cluster-binding protein [Aureliella helgolandensis]QDV26983.1 Flavohemoprotein [Aureliella helgolandensis]